MRVGKMIWLGDSITNQVVVDDHFLRTGVFTWCITHPTTSHMTHIIHHAFKTTPSQYSLFITQGGIHCSRCVGNHKYFSTPIY